MSEKRLHWIDNIKICACLLVLLGHFFQSMIKSEIIPETDIYKWFNNTIYLFHVPLFFVTSGFLYQRFSKVETIKDWGNNILKKSIALGIPYFFFSIITWILKTVFSDSVNDKIGGLSETLFLKPTSPYWFLYCLFFIFFVTPTLKNKKMAIVGLLISVCCKIVDIYYWNGGVYAIDIVLGNLLWFVIGMCLVFVLSRLDDLSSSFGYGCLIIFLLLSIKLKSGVYMTLLAIIGFVIVFVKNDKTNKFLEFLSKYTMPIFLMHTLFAAPLRVLLLKFRITYWFIHIPLGITISICGPIVVAWLMQKNRYLKFILYPWEVINTIDEKRNGFDVE